MAVVQRTESSCSLMTFIIPHRIRMEKRPQSHKTNLTFYVKCNSLSAMIQTFVDKTTAAIFAGLEVRRIPRELQQRTAEKLALLDAAHSVEDLRVPPGNRLEKLSGDRAGQWSIRVNRQWRICFTFVNGDAFDVELVDYH